MTDIDMQVHRCDGMYALYVDGQLDRGPTEEYLIVERIYQLLGIEEIADSAFLYAGPNGTPAHHLDEIDAYIEQRDQRNREADELQRQADELAERARSLRS